MKTTNWQTKALTLFIAAAACMSLMIACGNGAAKDECSKVGANLEEGEQSMTATAEKIHEVRLKHEAEFERFPGYIGIAEGHLINDDWSRDLSRSGIIVVVDREVDRSTFSVVDQSTLPVDERIPSCIEGVIVLVVGNPGARVPRGGGPITPTTEVSDE